MFVDSASAGVAVSNSSAAINMVLMIVPLLLS